MGTMYLLFLLAIACFMMAIISWHNLLDKARVDVIKGFLFLGWVAVVILELFIRLFGLVEWFFLPLCLALDLYAYLDAIVRFPSTPQFDSYFAFKLMVSVLGKTVIYATGFLPALSGSLMFLSAMFLNIWLLPVLYVMALPFGDTSTTFRKDRDMLIELYCIMTDASDREERINSIQTSWLSLRKQLLLGRSYSGNDIPSNNEKAYI